MAPMCSSIPFIRERLLAAGKCSISCSTLSNRPDKVDF
ncbi:hypothetical protein MTR67_030559 [Solanum verrucosum]|uniref:Uncharacterized protein n=1 Tax=Solanum verrucosum TaxID=315347 RepID=A0AAF0RE67_SOLVR|nr:hypothetical protein MTR67_030559 [Solanum verrucosum]